MKTWGKHHLATPDQTRQCPPRSDDHVAGVPAPGSWVSTWQSNAVITLAATSPQDGRDCSGREPSHQQSYSNRAKGGRARCWRQQTNRSPKSWKLAVGSPATKTHSHGAHQMTCIQQDAATPLHPRTTMDTPASATKAHTTHAPANRWPTHPQRMPQPATAE